MNLEQSIAAICEKHGLVTISISFTPNNSEGHRISSYAYSRSGECEGGWGTTVGEAIGNAIANLPPNPVTVSDEPIILDETA